MTKTINDLNKMTKYQLINIIKDQEYLIRQLKARI